MLGASGVVYVFGIAIPIMLIYFGVRAYVGRDKS
jgi:hypothetical protein